MNLLKTIEEKCPDGIVYILGLLKIFQSCKVDMAGMILSKAALNMMTSPLNNAAKGMGS